MNKTGLINSVRVREGMTVEQTKSVVNTVFDIISNEVAEGNDVYIPKFGRFSITDVAQKRCKHPETKEYVNVPAHKIVRFHMAEGFRRKLKGERQEK